MDAARREALRIAVERLEALLHEPQLVGAVVDREVRLVAEPLRLAAQDAPARGVERHHPRAARRRADKMVEALAHLRGGLVRERDREDLRRLRADGGEQVRDPTREHAGLPGARAGDHQQRPFGRQHRLQLRRIQVFEVRLTGGRGHRSSQGSSALRLSDPWCRPRAWHQGREVQGKDQTSRVLRDLRMS